MALKNELQSLPNACPYCHIAQVPDVLFGHRRGNNDQDVLFSCVVKDCRRTFIGYYLVRSSLNPPSYAFSGVTSIGHFQGKVFDEIIKAVSPEFVKIYGQAEQAEHMGLDQIAGMGYRKAVEFLLKDFIISLQPDDPDYATSIKKKLLGKCIEDHIQNPKLKVTSERAVWIGNDETHYVRRWENKDISNMKRYMEAAIHWIDMEKLTEDVEVDMPNPKNN